MPYSLAVTARQCYGSTRGQFLAIERKTLANRDMVARRIAQIVANVQGDTWTARKLRESLVFHIVATYKPAGQRYQRVEFDRVQGGPCGPRQRPIRPLAHRRAAAL